MIRRVSVLPNVIVDSRTSTTGTSAKISSDTTSLGRRMGEGGANTLEPPRFRPISANYDPSNSGSGQPGQSPRLFVSRESSTNSPPFDPLLSLWISFMFLVLSFHKTLSYFFTFYEKKLYTKGLRRIHKNQAMSDQCRVILLARIGTLSMVRRRRIKKLVILCFLIFRKRDQSLHRDE